MEIKFPQFELENKNDKSECYDRKGPISRLKRIVEH